MSGVKTLNITAMAKRGNECLLNCFCHTKEGDGSPAIDCCEHCCKLWTEHSAYKRYLKNSKYLYYDKHREKWRVMIRIEGTTIGLDIFASREEAAALALKVKQIKDKHRVSFIKELKSLKL